MKEILLIDYGLANMRSVINAIHYLGAEANVIKDGKDLKGGNRIILPGVGSFASGIKGLKERNFIEPLNELVLSKKIPFLGICLGFQLICEFSEEGNQDGLGWVKENIVHLKNIDSLRVPHIGWNDVSFKKHTKLFQDIEGPENFYFVHSYYLPFTENIRDIAAGTSSYEVEFVAAIEKDNIMACQFHPEKSQMAGLKLIENFLTI